MTSGFPLMLLPKRVVYVDDDGRMLDVLRMTMSKRSSREFITSPEAAAQVMSKEVEYWRSIEQMLAKSSDDIADGVGAAQRYAEEYFRDWRRFHLTGVLIVDYAMPGMTGLDLLRRLDGCPARRVLLTGQADAELAVQAFNSGLIHKFIPKSTPNLHKEITRCADEMHRSVCEHLGHLLLANLRSDQIELLHEPSVVRGLMGKIEELEWMEYLVVGNPFGVLGMAHGGPLQWLQIDTATSLEDLAAAMSDYGYPERDVRAVSTCTAVPVREIRQQFGLPDDRQLAVTDELASSPEVYCAVVDLPLPVVTAAEYGVDDIRTPEELMRCLLRDVAIAAKQAAADPRATVGLDQAVDHLSEMANLSAIHFQALFSTLGDSGLDAELRARVEAQVRIKMIGGRKNGPSR